MKCIIYMVLFVLMTFACSPGYKIDQYQDKEVSINPDYKDITVPHNIAPLNFTVNESLLSFVKYEVDGDSLIVHSLLFIFEELDILNVPFIIRIA